MSDEVVNTETGFDCSLEKEKNSNDKTYSSTAHSIPKVAKKVHYFNERIALVKPYTGRLLLGLIVLAITVLIELSYPKAIAYFIDQSIEKKETSEAWLTWVALLMLVVITIQAVATATRYYLFESTGSLIVTSLKRDLYKAIINQKIGFFDKRSVGELTSRLSSDVEMLQDTLTMSLALVLRALLTFIGAAYMLITLSPQLSLLILFIVPPTLFSSHWIGKRLVSNSKSRQEKLADCTELAQETFSNIRLVHAFTQEYHEQKKYHGITQKSLEFSLACTKLFAGFQGIGTLIQSIALMIILWFGGKLITSDNLSIGGLTSFILYTGMVAGSISTLASLWGDWMQSIGATQRVFELLGKESADASIKKEACISNYQSEDDLIRKEQEEFNSQSVVIGRDIEFKNVTFSYPSRSTRNALNNFTLQIKAGETIALIGPSGAGKSTIANLLLGFYQPNQGCITYGGVPSNQLELSNIRRNIAIVEQEPSLFSGSILDNIAYALLPNDIAAKNSSIESLEDAVVDAAKKANAHEFIVGFPEGYQTLMGSNGIQLSGGQKQRIAIARALLRDPKVLILDEATSALDSSSEKLVQSALNQLMKNRTTIMIAHRFSSIKSADRVVVMQQGRNVQIGCHKELIKKSDGLYYELFKNQVSF